MPGTSKKGGGLTVGSPYKMKGSPMQRNFGVESPLKGPLGILKAYKAAKWVGKGIKKLLKMKKKKKSIDTFKIPKLEKTGTKMQMHPQSGKGVYPKHGKPKTTNPNFIRNQAEWLKQTQKYWGPLRKKKK